jgi:hypothetical protein
LFNDWLKTQVDKTVSVSFPKKPERDRSTGQIVIDSENGIFIVQPMKLPEKITVPADSVGSSKFLSGVVNGSLKSIKGKTLSETDLTVGNIFAKEAKFEGVFPGGDVNGIGYKEVFIVNHVLYNFDYWVLGEETEESIAEKNRFFNSIDILVKE